MASLGEGKFRVKTIDTAHLRIKYFFGYAYSYGKGKGKEKFYHKTDVSAIPEWIQTRVIGRMEEENLVPKGWINSVVLNDYEKGGFIVQHQPRVYFRPFESFYLCFEIFGSHSLIG